MKPARLEAFSDGVLAILITIMVLELRVPHGADFGALRPILPVLLCYLLSFVYVGIYWNNHHHMLNLTKEVNGAILWANLNLLFWLSLIPFVTAWMGENRFAPAPTSCYGMVMFLAAVSYTLLQRTIIASQGQTSVLRTAVGRDLKGIGSIVLYAMGIVVSLFFPWLGGALYATVALIWLVPDRRIERMRATHS